MSKEFLNSEEALSVAVDAWLEGNRSVLINAIKELGGLSGDYPEVLARLSVNNLVYFDRTDDISFLTIYSYKINMLYFSNLSNLFLTEIEEIGMDYNTLELFQIFAARKITWNDLSKKEKKRVIKLAQIIEEKISEG